MQAVENRLAEAVETLKRLKQKRDKPSRPRSQWPEVVANAYLAYGYNTPHTRPIPPEPGEITRMDQVIFEWLPKLWGFSKTPKEFKQFQTIVWARAEGYSYGTIAKMFEANGIGISKDTIARRHKMILGFIERISKEVDKIPKSK